MGKKTLQSSHAEAELQSTLPVEAEHAGRWGTAGSCVLQQITNTQHQSSLQRGGGWLDVHRYTSHPGLLYTFAANVHRFMSVNLCIV